MTKIRKPVKPMRAWAVVDKEGQLLMNISDVPLVVATQKQAKAYCQTDWEGKPFHRPVRVRIVAEENSK